jgi:hypothetical protein
MVSLLIGLLLVQLRRLGAHLELHAVIGGTSIGASTLTFRDFVTQLVPTLHLRPLRSLHLSPPLQPRGSAH